MVYENETDAKMDLLSELLKKEAKLQNNLIKTRLNIRILEKDIQGGASLDNVFEEDIARRKKPMDPMR